jgi:hypothetical protein
MVWAVGGFNTSNEVIRLRNTQKQLVIKMSTPATSNTSGALQVYGGVGIQGNLYSGNYYITGSGNGITFVDGTTQLTAGAPYNYANAAYTQANVAYGLANTALQNTASIITAGNLTVANNLIVANTISTSGPSGNISGVNTLFANTVNAFVSFAFPDTTIITGTSSSVSSNSANTLATSNAVFIAISSALAYSIALG